MVAVRGGGLWAGIDVDPRLGDGRAVCEAMARRGVLVKDTHGATIRLSPPLVAQQRRWTSPSTLGAVLAELS